MNNRLVITNYKERIISILYENDKAVQINTQSREENSILNNIYIGKVKNIINNIEAAFVEIENGIMCYFSLKDEKNIIYLNKQNQKKICIGDEILVQVIKEAVNKKAPVVTGYINITGKYTVLTHGKLSISVSNKIHNEKEVQRLKGIISKYKNNDFGIIARTNSFECEDDLIEEEIHNLQKIYYDIIGKAKFLVPFSKVYTSPLGYICDIRDSYSRNIEKIVTDDVHIYENIRDYLEYFQKDELSKLELYKDEMISLNALYNINSSVAEALKEKVWLKSGGTIVIQPTEALVAIDVNTSKAIVGKSDASKAFLKTNLEAAHEIARQLRLRNLSGIIIVDFIDLKKEEDKRYLLNEFDKILRLDPIKTTVVDMTGLNLVEVTRKKTRKPLYQQLKSD